MLHFVGLCPRMVSHLPIEPRRFAGKRCFCCVFRQHTNVCRTLPIFHRGPIFRIAAHLIEKRDCDMTESEGSLRSMNCEVNQLSMSDGSSMFMQGETCCVAAVYGPVEARLQKMMHDKASVEVTFSPIKGPPSVEDRTKELFLKESCESALLLALHPATAISVNVQEMRDDGGLLSCAVNAACMALVNCGLPMKYTIAAVSCAIDGRSGEFVLDPDASQLRSATASFAFAFDSVERNLVSCRTTGRCKDHEFIGAMEKCRAASRYVFDFYRDIVKKYADCI